MSIVRAILSFYLRMIQKCFHIEFSIQASLGSGLFWMLLGILFSIGAELQKFFPAFVPGLLDYGRIKPTSSLILIFGGFFNFFMGLSFFILQSHKEIQKPLSFLSFIAVKLHNFGLFIGIILVLGGYSTGREFGEFPWISANFLFLSLLIFLGVVSFHVDSKKLSPPLVLILSSTVGAIVIFVIGNFALPYSLLASVPILGGIEDSMLQEIYRSGLLSFWIVLPLIAFLYHFIPFYYKTELYASSLGFLIPASLILTPLASPSGLVFSAVPEWVQTMGISSAIALNLVFIAGGLNASFSITRSSTRAFRSDSIGGLLRTGIFFLILAAVLRALFSTRWLQPWFEFGPMNRKDISFDVLSYGFMISLASVSIVLQIISKQNYSRKILFRTVSLIILGTIFMYVGNLGSAMIEHFHLSNMSLPSAEGGLGDLVVGSWSDIYFKGGLFPGKTTAMNYFLSLKGLSFFGLCLIGIGALLFCLHSLYLAIFPPSKDSSYHHPDLTDMDIVIAGVAPSVGGEDEKDNDS